MKRQGRPPLDANSETPSADVHLKLAAEDYDSAHKLRQRGQSIQDVIRLGLKRLIENERGA